MSDRFIDNEEARLEACEQIKTARSYLALDMTIAAMLSLSMMVHVATCLVMGGSQVCDRLKLVPISLEYLAFIAPLIMFTIIFLFRYKWGRSATVLGFIIGSVVVSALGYVPQWVLSNTTEQIQLKKEMSYEKLTLLDKKWGNKVQRGVFGNQQTLYIRKDSETSELKEELLSFILEKKDMD